MPYFHKALKKLNEKAKNQSGDHPSKRELPTLNDWDYVERRDDTSGQMNFEKKMMKGVRVRERYDEHIRQPTQILKTENHFMRVVWNDEMGLMLKWSWKYHRVWLI